jgi:NMD protein affecting ribosome stability and mRNA decay
MGKRRNTPPKLAKLKSHPGSEDRCWFCGETRNVPAKRYDGLCMSCWWDFHEDDIILELSGVRVPAA